MSEINKRSGDIEGELDGLVQVTEVDEYKILKRKACEHFRFNSNMTNHSKFRYFSNF